MRTRSTAHRFEPPAAARYRLLDQILRRGALPADADTSLPALCDAGLVYRLFAPANPTYAITEWGRIVWRRERRRVERLGL